MMFRGLIGPEFLTIRCVLSNNNKNVYSIPNDSNNVHDGRIHHTIVVILISGTTPKKPKTRKSDK